MILADTSVWVDHLRAGDEALAALLARGEIAIHPHVLGEIALGNLRQRAVVLESLGGLPRTDVASEAEVVGFIETVGLYGLGIGYVDAHLLAAARLTPGLTIWTRDKRLREAAEKIGAAAALA
ncbi:type II toxin-antitoxin system VapC family toxin [soil metagenome]